MDRRLTRVTDVHCFSFHDAAESTWESCGEAEWRRLLVQVFGGSSNDSSEFCVNRQRKCV